MNARSRETDAFDRPTLVWIVVLVGLSWLSLWFSHFVFTTKSWESAFGKPFGSAKIGWLIEGGRSLLLVSFGLLLLRFPFRAETARVLNLSGIVSWKTDSSQIARLLLVIIGLISLYALVNHHFFEAPAQLKLASGETIADQQVTYAWYFTYSFILFVAIDLPLLIIPLYGGLNDYWTLRSARKRLQVNIARVKSRRKKEDQVGQLFGDFRKICEDSIRRYFQFFSAIVVICVYEYLIGHYTQSSRANVFFVLANTLLCSSVVCVYQICAFYDVGYRRAKDARQEAEGDTWADKNNQWAFIKSVCRDNINGIIVLLVISAFGYGFVARIL